MVCGVLHIVHAGNPWLAGWLVGWLFVFIFPADNSHPLSPLQPLDLALTDDIRQEIGSVSLLKACAIGDAKKVSHLLKIGVSPNGTDKQGRSPLIYACRSGHLSVVDVLLKAGCDQKVVSKDGSTALIFAARIGQSKILKALLAHEDSISIIDKQQMDGFTALHFSVKGNSKSCVDVLLKHGADARLKTKNGDTVLQLSPNDEIRMCFGYGTDGEGNIVRKEKKECLIM